MVIWEGEILKQYSILLLPNRNTTIVVCEKYVGTYIMHL